MHECSEHSGVSQKKVWKASRSNDRQAGAVVLKLKTKEFSSFTRSVTLKTLLSSCEELVDIATSLTDKVELPQEQLYSLVGVGLSNFRLDEPSEESAEPALKLIADS